MNLKIDAFFGGRSITCILRFLLSVVIMFYFFASFKQVRIRNYTGFVEVRIKHDREAKNWSGRNKLFARYRGAGAKSSLGRLN